MCLTFGVHINAQGIFLFDILCEKWYNKAKTEVDNIEFKMITGDVFDYSADALVFLPVKMLLLAEILMVGVFIILTIQVFTVIWQVVFASIIGTFHGYGFTNNFIPNYLSTYCKNFVMALLLQLIIVGPFARFIFRSIFRKK